MSNKFLVDLAYIDTEIFKLVKLLMFAGNKKKIYFCIINYNFNIIISMTNNKILFDYFTLHLLAKRWKKYSEILCNRKYEINEKNGMAKKKGFSNERNALWNLINKKIVGVDRIEAEHWKKFKKKLKKKLFQIIKYIFMTRVNFLRNTNLIIPISKKSSDEKM